MSSNALTPSLRPLVRTGFALALLAAFAVSLAPSPAMPEIVAEQDKLGHFLAFFGLGVFGLVAFPQHRGMVVATLLVHGAAIEIAQSFTEYRRAELLDWVADALGVAAAVVVDLLRRKLLASANFRISR